MHTGWQRAARQVGMRTAVPAAFVLPSLLLASCVFVLVCARARAFVGACAAVYTHAVPADGMHARWAGWGNGPKTACSMEGGKLCIITTIGTHSGRSL